MAGKLKGVMPADHPQGLHFRPAIDAGAGIPGMFPLEQFGDAASVFHHFDAALQFAARVVQHFAVLGG